MVNVKSWVLCLGIAATLSVQSCGFTHLTPNPEAEKIAMARWNLCLKRFQANPEHFCDGHRRDVLSAYPAYMEHQLNDRLARQVSVDRMERLMKTGFGITTQQNNNRSPDNFMANGGEAREGDL